MLRAISRRAFGLLLISAAAASAQSFYLKNGDTVVFYGDSITDQRLYTTFTESYAVTRFPGMNFTFVHSGWGGDRVTGGGGGPVDVRLQRDVIAYKPNVMTIMLGMNDGSYQPFDQTIFKTYADGYTHIVDSVKQRLPGIRITAIEPSPFDDVTRPPQFDGGYNGVLVRYGDFVKELAQKDHLTVADLNAPVVADLKRAEAIDAEQAGKLIPDRVHPGPAGHLLMAAALLKAWNAPAVVSSVEIDGAAGKLTKAENTEVTQVAKGSPLTWTQRDRALPMPVDMKDKLVALAMQSSDIEKTLDWQPLRVTGLAAGNYVLSIDGEKVGTFSADQLGSGVNLALLDTPMLKQALDVHGLTLKHNNVHFARWRTVQVPLEKDGIRTASAMQALDALERDLVARQRAAAQPKPHRFELRPE